MMTSAVLRRLAAAPKRVSRTQMFAAHQTVRTMVSRPHTSPETRPRLIRLPGPPKYGSKEEEDFITNLPKLKVKRLRALIRANGLKVVQTKNIPEVLSIMKAKGLRELCDYEGVKLHCYKDRGRMIKHLSSHYYEQRREDFAN